MEQVTFPRKQWPGPNKMLVSRAYHSLAHPRRARQRGAGRPGDRLQLPRKTTMPMPAGWRSCSFQDIPAETASAGGARPGELCRIVDWLDANAVCYGDYSWNKCEWREPCPKARERSASRFAAALGRRWPNSPSRPW